MDSGDTDREESADPRAMDRGDVAQLSVPGMDCPSCAGKVRNAIDRLTGVSTYETQPTTGNVAVTYDATAVEERDIVAAIESAGYDVANTASERTAGGDAEIGRAHV